MSYSDQFLFEFYFQNDGYRGLAEHDLLVGRIPKHKHINQFGRRILTLDWRPREETR